MNLKSGENLMILTPNGVIISVVSRGQIEFLDLAKINIHLVHLDFLNFGIHCLAIAKTYMTEPEF